MKGENKEEIRKGEELIVSDENSPRRTSISIFASTLIPRCFYMLFQVSKLAPIWFVASQRNVPNPLPRLGLEGLFFHQTLISQTNNIW